MPVRRIARLFARLLAVGVAGAAATVSGLVLYTWRTKRRVEREVPPDGRFLDLDGARIHYVDAGSGPPIVLIHGLGGQLLNFPPDSLVALRRDYRVLALDRPGNGYSTLSAGAVPTLAAHAAAVAGFIEALGLRRPVLVGHSFGGAVALRLALDRPDLVGGLALVSPLTHPYDAMPPMFQPLVIRSALLRWLVSWTLVTPAAVRHRDEVLSHLFAPDPAPPGFDIDGGGSLNLRPSGFYATSSELVALDISTLAGMAARYGELAMPVGVLFGTGDAILDHRLNGVALQGVIPGLDLELIEAGHMIPVAAPERSVAFIRRVAERVAARP